LGARACQTGSLHAVGLFALKRPFEGSRRWTNHASGVHHTMVVAMKLHNLAISEGWESNQNPFDDLFEHDTMGTAYTQRMRADGREVRSKDARGRERAVHPDDVHFTSPNEAMGEREEAEGDHEAASAARQPAWFEDEGLSPRDPLYAESCTCGIRATMTSEIQDKQIVFVRAMKKK
jgi:hypothetical protein